MKKNVTEIITVVHVPGLLYMYTCQAGDCDCNPFLLLKTEDRLRGPLKIIDTFHESTNQTKPGTKPEPQEHNKERMRTDALRVLLNTKDHHPTTTVEQ